MRSVIGWVQACHPFPLFAVVSLTGLIGVASAGEDLDAGRLARVLLAMLLAQLVIGWTNDYADRGLDATFQPWKPIPSGLVESRLAPFAAGAAGLAALGVSAGLGWAPAVCVAIGMGAGLAYNFALKAGPLSWLPFVVAFAVLPPYVWTGLDVWEGAFLALYPVALPLTVAAHLANALPDVETDRAAGRAGFVVQLGRAYTLRVLIAALVVPAVLAVSSVLFVDHGASALTATLSVYAALVALAWLTYAWSGGRRGCDVWGFRVVVAASLVFVTGWLVSVK
jgi:4-hydroxybenzoate polyprenyltransferase